MHEAVACFVPLGMARRCRANHIRLNWHLWLLDRPGLSPTVATLGEKLVEWILEALTGLPQALHKQPTPEHKESLAQPLVEVM